MKITKKDILNGIFKRFTLYTLIITLLLVALPQTVNAASNDDPGYDRLSGKNIPADFFSTEDENEYKALGLPKYGSFTSQSPFTKQTLTHNDKFKDTTIYNGIDVSEWQKDIDWKAVKNAGISFVFIRAGYRGKSTGKLVEDPYFRKNVEGALANDIKVGVYFYTEAINGSEAVAEADFVYSLIKNYKITMPVAFDYEYQDCDRSRQRKALTSTEKTLICSYFCERIKQYGYTPAIYASRNPFEKEFNTAEFTKRGYTIWLAEYNNESTTHMSKYNGDYEFWQYASVGTVPGISGNVDMNVWYCPVKPAKATPPVFVSNTVNSITMSYDSKDPVATGYRILRSYTPNGNYVPVYTAPNTKMTSYTDQRLYSGYGFYYKVQAYTLIGDKYIWGDMSDPVLMYTPLRKFLGFLTRGKTAVYATPSTEQPKTTVQQYAPVLCLYYTTGADGQYWLYVAYEEGGRYKYGYIPYATYYSAQYAVMRTNSYLYGSTNVKSNKRGFVVRNFPVFVFTSRRYRGQTWYYVVTSYRSTLYAGWIPARAATIK